MAKASITEKVNVPLEHFFKTICAYEHYPQFVTGCSRVEINRKTDSLVHVTYFVSLMKDISYVLEQNEDSVNGTMTWSLLSSDALKSNKGKWTLKSLAPSLTEVTYEIDIEFKIPVPGFILSGLIKSSLPSMLKNFSEFAKKSLPKG